MYNVCRNVIIVFYVTVHACTQCSKTFQRPCDLHRHQLTHSGEWRSGRPWMAQIFAQHSLKTASTIFLTFNLTILKLVSNQIVNFVRNQTKNIKLQLLNMSNNSCSGFICLWYALCMVMCVAIKWNKALRVQWAKSHAAGETLPAATQAALVFCSSLLQVPIYCKFNNICRKLADCAGPSKTWTKFPATSIAQCILPMPNYHTTFS